MLSRNCRLRNQAEVNYNLAKDCLHKTLQKQNKDEQNINLRFIFFCHILLENGSMTCCAFDFKKKWYRSQYLAIYC